ncbi:bestrophin-like domain [Rhizobacter sp. P5_C2]
MPLWLYDLPAWLFGLVIVSTWAALGVGGHALFHRFVRTPFRDAEREVAIALLAVVATINSLLLAFCAVSAWESFGSAEKAVGAEANAIGELARDLAVYNTPASREARERLRGYARTVVDEEWPTMRIGQESPQARDLFDVVFRAVAEVKPVTPADSALMPEIWARVNELVKFRRVRVASSQGEVPGALWAVVVLGTLLTVMPTYVLPRTRFNRCAIGILSVSMGLVFFLVAAMDRPFVGTESVTPGAFEMSLRNMTRWDVQSRVAVERDLSERLR